MNFYEEIALNISFSCLQGTPVTVPINVRCIGSLVMLNIASFSLTSGTGSYLPNAWKKIVVSSISLIKTVVIKIKNSSCSSSCTGKIKKNNNKATNHA